MSCFISVCVGYYGEEPDRKRVKLEASFQNVSKIAEEYTTKKLAKRNHGKFTESFTEKHDKCNSIDRDSKITKDIQAEHFTYESKKSSTAIESDKKPQVDSNRPSFQNKGKANLSKQESIEGAAIHENDDFQSSDASQPEGVHDKAEIKKAEYVYRLLRFREPYHRGLCPKDIHSKTTLMKHVENGSKGVESRFISCCKTLSGLEKLASITNKSNGYRGVVRIDITKLNPGEVNMIDLPNERKTYYTYFKSLGLC